MLLPVLFPCSCRVCFICSDGFYYKMYVTLTYIHPSSVVVVVVLEEMY